MHQIDPVVQRVSVSLYKPLETDDEIRLLYLQPRDGNDTVECSIEHVKLSHKPEYEALSYSWGPEIMETIQFEGGDWEVRENLLEALRHLRWENRTRTLWVDALCINQSDLKERLQQVALMGEIYTQALGVIAWIGVASDSSPSVIQFILELADVSSLSPSNMAVRCLYDHVPGEVWHLYNGFTASDNVILGLVEGIYKFCTRAYWGRLWIVQEVLLAAKVTIQCGTLSLSWDRLAAFFDQVKVATDDHTTGTVGLTELRDNPWLSPRSVQQSSCNRLASARVHKRRVGRDHERAGKIPLLVLVSKYAAGAKCSDDRDRVLGLCGLTTQCCFHVVSMSYETTFVEMCDKLLLHHIHAHPPGPQNRFKTKKCILPRAKEVFGMLYDQFQASSSRHPFLTFYRRPNLCVQNNSMNDDTFQLNGILRSRIQYLTALHTACTDKNLQFPSMASALSRYLRQMRNQIWFWLGGQQTKLEAIGRVEDSRLHAVSALGSYPTPNTPSSSSEPETTWDDKARKTFRKFVEVAANRIYEDRRSNIKLSFDGKRASYVPETTMVGDFICNFPFQDTLIVCRLSEKDESKCRIIGFGAELFSHRTDILSILLEPDNAMRLALLEERELAFRRATATHAVHFDVCLDILANLYPKDSVLPEWIPIDVEHTTCEPIIVQVDSRNGDHNEFIARLDPSGPWAGAQSHSRYAVTGRDIQNSQRNQSL